MFTQFEQSRRPLKVRDALEFGWRTLLRRLPFFAGIIVVLRLTYYGLHAAKTWLAAYLPVVPMVIFIVEWGFGIAVSITFIRISLMLVDGAQPGLPDLRLSTTTFFRFVVASLSYTLAAVGLGLLASVVLSLTLTIVLDIKSGLGALSVVLSVGESALAAASAIGTFRVGRWLFDRQLYGHLIVDRDMGPGAALRRSAVLASMARWQLLGVTSLLIGIAIVLGSPVILIGHILPNDPRVPLRLPHINTGWPPLAISALRETLDGLAALDGWLLALALSFAYRTLSNHPLATISPESPEWRLHRSVVAD